MILRKRVRYLLEGCCLYLFYGFFKLLPLDAASATGGWIGRTIGPRLGASKKALHNLKRAIPDKPEDTYTQIITGMWDNLGRVFAEYPHLKQIASERVKLNNLRALNPRELKGPAIYISGHLANWETIGPGLHHYTGLQGLLVYRAPNNPISARLLSRARQFEADMRFTTKSERGVRDMIKELKNKGVIGLLIDQKFNRGYSVPFFGRPAMTSPVFVELAQKFNASLIPLQIVRLQGAYFEMTIHPDIDHQAKNVEDVLRETHRYLEEWITQHPEQWLWLHRRWKDI